MVSGGRRNDMPGVKYKIVRTKKFPLSILLDHEGSEIRISSRSVYGLKKILREPENSDRQTRRTNRRIKQDAKNLYK
jgi:hypothetical protein